MHYEESVRQRQNESSNVTWGLKQALDATGDTANF